MTLGPGNGRIFPNTDAYQNGSIRVTGVTITDIKKVDTLMTFRVSGLSKTETVPPLPLLTEVPTADESPFTEDLSDASDEGVQIGRDENTTGAIMEPFQDGIDFAEPTKSSIQSSSTSSIGGGLFLKNISISCMCWAVMRFLL